MKQDLLKAERGELIEFKNREIHMFECNFSSKTKMEKGRKKGEKKDKRRWKSQTADKDKNFLYFRKRKKRKHSLFFPKVEIALTHFPACGSGGKIIEEKIRREDQERRLEERRSEERRSEERRSGEDQRRGDQGRGDQERRSEEEREVALSDSATRRGVDRKFDICCGLRLL